MYLDEISLLKDAVFGKGDVDIQKPLILDERTFCQLDVDIVFDDLGIQVAKDGGVPRFYWRGKQMLRFQLQRLLSNILKLKKGTSRNEQ